MTQLKALGGLRLESSSAKPFTQPKPLLLLAYLSLEGTRQRKHLAELFWQDGNRMKSLSMTLTRVRQGVGEVVAADDKQTWSTLISDAKELLESLDKSDWQRASELYTGAFLEGVVLEDWSSELEDWVYTTREYLAERVQYALLNLAEDAAKRQDFDKAREFAERAYKLPGLNGSEIANLKRLYPLLAASNSLLAPEVRKELDGYGITVQLSRDEARRIFQTTKVASQLPTRQTSFVGRDVELTELASTLASVQLLTLLGTAGVGKTRLALQLAHEQQKLGAFERVYFVSLESVSSAKLIIPTILTTLGLHQQGKTEPLTRLLDFIGGRSILLILDNLEHLAGQVNPLSSLIQHCPNLKLLVTSRERLGLEKEYLFPLEGLAFPSSNTMFEEAKTSDAVALFSQRAQQLQPQFDLKEQLESVLRICKLVEGLPLGLELAASWVRLMSCTEIAGEIESTLEFLTTTTRNVPERHRSLKAAFEYSWNLLTIKEQEVLRKLAVFRGGFRREAASEVVGATIPSLASLVDKSLLRVLPNGRYDRHPLLYQFTKEKSLEHPDEQLNLQEHHARYYLAFAEHADARLKGKEQVLWFERLDEELDNLREALEYLETKDDSFTALHLATSLGYFWNTRGYYTEGSSHFMNLLEKTSGDTLLRAKASSYAGDLLWKWGDHTKAETFYRGSLETSEALDEKPLRAKALIGLGKISEVNRGDFENAYASYQSALEFAKASEDKGCIADVLCRLGGLSSERGNYQHAQTCYETATKLYDELGNGHDRAKTLINLATVLTYLGDINKAHALNREALELLRAVGDRHGIGVVLLNLGIDAVEVGKRHEAITLYQESLQLFRDLGDKRMVSHLLNNLGGNFQRLGEFANAKHYLEESLSIQKQIGDVSLIAHALYILGQVHHDEGDLLKARETYRECIDLCRKNEDNWTLMRVLEVSAKLHLQAQEFECARVELGEAHELAQHAGDKKTLRKILETNVRLEEAVKGSFQSVTH